MRVKIIVVEPKYQINVGYIARVASNFGLRRLFFVKPRAKLGGEKARMYAKHAYPLLQSATIYKDLATATRDCNLVIGTSGVWRKGKTTQRVMLVDEAIRKAKKARGTVGIVIGRDDTGLRKEEIERCDALAYIPTDSAYPVLNVSHALAIILYLLEKEKLKLLYEDMGAHEPADAREAEKLFAIVAGLVSKKEIRDKKAVLNTFRRVVRNANPSRTELHSLISALK